MLRPTAMAFDENGNFLVSDGTPTSVALIYYVAANGKFNSYLISYSFRKFD